MGKEHILAWRKALEHFGVGAPPKKGTEGYRKVKAVYDTYIAEYQRMKGGYRAPAGVEEKKNSLRHAKARTAPHAVNIKVRPPPAPPAPPPPPAGAVNVIVPRRKGKPAGSVVPYVRVTAPIPAAPAINLGEQFRQNKIKQQKRDKLMLSNLEEYAKAHINDEPVDEDNEEVLLKDLERADKSRKSKRGGGKRKRKR